MGRRAGVSPEETRRAVLDAALKTFAELGYHGASTRAIGAAADLTIGAVHHHFGSKGDLYQACVEEADERLAGLIQETMATFAKEGSLEDATRVAVRALGDSKLSLAIRLVARKVWEDPEGEIQARLTSHGGSLFRGAEIVSQARKIPLLQARIRVQAAVFVLARFALSPAEERSFVTGEDDVDKATAILEEELVATLLHIVTK